MRFRDASVCTLLALGLVASSAHAQILLAWGQQPSLDEFRKSLSPNVGSPEHAVDKMLQVANLKPGEMLFDLGCGDGRILIAAASKYKVKGVGIEISEHLAKTAAERVKKAGLQNDIRIIHGDFMKTDLSSANVVTLYLATEANDTLRPNLERYLKPLTRVVSYDYPIPGWKPIETTDTEGRTNTVHTIYLYEVPASIIKK